MSLASLRSTMATFLQDLRYALRTLTRARSFALIVILTLGLGIGANTAIFSLADQVLLRLLPVRDPEQLVQLDGPGTFSGRTQDERTFSYPMYVDLRDRNDVFAGLIGRYGSSATLTFRSQAERVDVELVSGNTFEVLGVSAAVGRTLTIDDDRLPGGHPVAMLGYGYWQRRFGGDQGVLNQIISINGAPMTIVGIAPPAFAGVLSVSAPDVFVPMMMKGQITPTWNDLDNRRSRWVTIVGRLKPDLTPEAAKARLDVLYRQINEHELVAVPVFAQWSDRIKDRFRAKTLILHPAAQGLSDVREGFSTALVVLMAMVGLVLLIACANVVNLLLVRATARQKEMAVRLALGASRGRLVRQAFTESLVLAGAGGVVGAMLSVWLGELLVSTLPSDGFARAISTSPDLRVGLFTAAATLTTAVVFGLAPALHGARLELNRAMRDEAGSIAGGTHHARFRKGLVVAQVALSTLLVAGGALFARSLYNLRHVNTGFDTDHLVSFAVDPSRSGYDQARVGQFYDRLLANIRSLPGVTSASLAEDAVLTGSSSRRTIQVLGYQSKPDENMNATANEVGPDYFRTMRLPLVAGREFTERDVAGAPLVAVVNETFAKYFFGRDNPTGRRFGWTVLRNAGAIEIVGVVRDSLYDNLRQGTSEQNQTPRFVYTPYQQGEGRNEMTFYVRASPAAAATMPDQLRRAVRLADASMPVYNLQSIDTTVDRSLFAERMLAMLSAAFGLVATLLAAIGLYGVMSYTVSRRTREIGIRVALGAERATVLWLILREVALLTAVGIVVGIPAVLGLSRLVRSQLFGISPNDPSTLALAACLLALVGLAAGWLPARRAAGVEPILALRHE